MAGISDKAIKTQYAENKFRYNGGNELQNKEFSDGSGLEEYDAENRMYDPQLGRFWQIDPLADISENWSPYAFANNDPIRLNDPLGLDTGTRKVNLDPVVVTPGKTPDHGSAVTTGLADTKGGDAEVTAAPAPAPSNVAVNGTSSGGSNSSNGYLSGGGILALTWEIPAGAVSGTGLIIAAGTVYVGLMIWAAYDIPRHPHPAPAMPLNDISVGVPKPYIPDDIANKAAAAAALAAAGEKTLEQLIPGSLKRSPSWHDPYGSKTPTEIRELAKKGDKNAQKMKKLLDQIDRLLDKNKNK